MTAALATYTPDAFAMALQAIIEQRRAAVRAAAAHLSDARLRADAGRAHATGRSSPTSPASRGPATPATFTRPMFQGKLAADVEPAGDAPWFITFQIGAFRADAVQKSGTAPVTAVRVTIDAAAIRQKPEAPFQEAKQAVDLSQAERIVAVGRGIKAQENIAIAEKLAKALGAELAASRPICDNGWLPMERQIGSSGQTVAPKLYVALGISGAIQHLVGMKGARTIVAINKDADAPIFEVADYGIVGDLFEIVPALCRSWKRLACSGQRAAAGAAGCELPAVGSMIARPSKLTCSSSAAVPPDCPRRCASRSCRSSRAATRSRLRCSRRRARPGLTCCPAPSWIRRRSPSSSRTSRRRARRSPQRSHEDHVYFLTQKGQLPFPIIPPPLRNHGNYIISLNRLRRGWRSRSRPRASISSRDSPGRTSSWTAGACSASVPATGASASTATARRPSSLVWTLPPR